MTIYYQTKKEEKIYLEMVHKIKEKHGLQTKLFSLIPTATKFDLFIGRCELCDHKLTSRPMYVLKIPGQNMYKIKYLCQYCANLHEKYIVMFFILKN